MVMILVSGYYGYHNSGDEAVLAAICADLTALGIERNRIIVFSGAPQETEQLHRVHAVSRYNPQALVSAFKHGKLLISGGGSLLQDSTGPFTVPYYLGMIKLALAFGLKVIVYSQGIGPVRNPIYQRWISKTFQRVDGISLRDHYSVELLQNWGVNPERITLAADNVFNTLTVDAVDNKNQEKTDAISVNLRPYNRWREDFSEWVDLIRTWILEHRWSVHFVALGPGDEELARELMREIPQLTLIIPDNWQEAYNFLRKTEFCVSMRLHGIIFAALGGTLPIGLNYDPKIRAICEQLGIKFRSAAPSCELTDDLQDLRQNEFTYRRQLASKVENLQRLSLNNRRLIEAQLSYLAVEESNEKGKNSRSKS